MIEKQRIEPGETYVLDEDDVEQLDEMTLTSVIRDAAAIADATEEGEQPSPDLDDLDLAFLDD